MLAFIATFLFAATASAHSVVSPSETFTSKNETFSISVPTEEEVPTIGVRLLVPPEIDRVRPIVKPGWRIQLKKDVAGKITEIIWSGGSIPADQKDVFTFSGRAPATSTTLVWKVYQTYRGGKIVAWDRDPQDLREGEESVATPYSTTVVKNQADDQKSPDSSRLPLTFSLVALALAAFSLVRSYSKRA